ncbi:class I SAM-dependent methyltransferase [Pseudovibrio ascidiaceicola]|uniref:class I SAM-dependent methyltransferase n=1 Tax=Pseudovibrio ascidiaceicola TaxID=285279 RepID=UPI003D36EAF5
MSVDVSQQYKTSSNLKTRANLHRRYANKNWFEWAFKQMELQENDKIADVGCGTGWFWTANQHRLPTGLEVSLLDQSAQMIAEAEEALVKLPAIKQVTTCVEQAEAIPFEDASFDVVMAMHMVYHLSDTDKAMDEMRRILKPGGRLIITLNSPTNLQQVYELNSRVFDVAPIDPSVVIAPPNKIAERLQHRFNTLSLQTYKDVYAIDDTETVFSTLTSYPPGNEATPQQQEQLMGEITRKLEEHNGTMHTPHEVLMFVAGGPREV